MEDNCSGSALDMPIGHKLPDAVAAHEEAKEEEDLDEIKTEDDLIKFTCKQTECHDFDSMKKVLL
jgi:hypothetical protein